MFKKYFILFILCFPIAALAQNLNEESSKDAEELSSESAFLDGMKEYIAENYAKSASIFGNVLNKQKASAGIYHMQSKAYLHLNELSKASSAAKSSLELEKENVYYQKFYADVLYKQLDYNAAINLYKKVIKKNPLDISSYLHLSDIYVHLEDYDSAIKLYNQVEKNIGEDEEISHRKQMLYLRQNKVDEAIEEGDRMIKNQPLEPEYILNQAQIMISNQKLDDAKKLLKNYLKDDPNLAEGHILLADIYRRQDDLEACHSELQIAFDNALLDPKVKLQVLGSYIKLVEDKPDTERINNAISLTQKLINKAPDLAGSYVYMGDLLMRKGLPEEARKNYLQSLKYDKSVFEVWLAIVELDTKLNDNAALVRDAQNAVDYFPNQAFFWYHLGYGNVLIKDYDEAIYALDEARNLAFDNVELLKHILALLGDSYNALKQYSSSEKWYDEVLKIDPNYTIVLNNYSYFLAMRGAKLDKAKTLSEKLVSISPTNAEHLDTYAWVLFQMQDYAKAKTIIEKAIEVSKKNSGTLLEHYGDILFKLGNKDLAVEQWKKAKLTGETSIHLDKKILEQQYVE
jgi:tetratricopeptide (TPR) repeat protein